METQNSGTARPLVRMASIGRDYISETTTVQALKDVSFEIRPNELFAVLGPSGCGKSTLLNIIAGFDAQSSGVAEFMGQPVPPPSPTRGVVFQDTNALFPWLTVEQNIEFGLRSLKLSATERKDRVKEILELVRLHDFAQRFPRELSGGMRQLVAIARVVVMKVDLLLMDEPFGALDAITRQHMQEQLIDIWSKAKSSIMFITHSVDEAIFLGDRVAVMSARPGRILEILDVAMERPRDRTSESFNRLRGRSLELLRNVH